VLERSPERQREDRFRAREAFEQDLLESVTPLIKANYRVGRARSAAPSRALEGGGQSIAVGLGHLDQFAWVGAFSSAVAGDDPCWRNCAAIRAQPIGS
jgi:enterochelin esterase-like enzyme